MSSRESCGRPSMKGEMFNSIPLSSSKSFMVNPLSAIMECLVFLLIFLHTRVSSTSEIDATYIGETKEITSLGVHQMTIFPEL